MVVRYQFNRQLLKKLNIHIPWAYHFHYWVYTQQKCIYIYALKEMDNVQQRVNITGNAILRKACLQSWPLAGI